MLDEASSAAERLGVLIWGFRASRMIHVAATLGIADLLAGGPRLSDDLADATGTHPAAIYRLLRALASVGVFREEYDHRFAMTPLGDCLRSDAAEPLCPSARHYLSPHNWQVWGDLLHVVRTGENANQHLFGMSAPEYHIRHPEDGAAFDAAMTSLTQLRAPEMVAAYDFGRFGQVVDVGGGQGTLLAAILAKHPATTGVLFDQPHVVANAEPILRAAGVLDRCQIVGGNFFEAVPDGGDAYVLKSILHGWDDAQASAILRTCGRAMGSAGTLLAVERVLGPPNEDSRGKLSDLNMLVAAEGGRERTREEWAALLQSAGFRLVGVTPTAGWLSVIEAVPE